MNTGSSSALVSVLHTPSRCAYVCAATFQTLPSIFIATGNIHHTEVGLLLLPKCRTGSISTCRPVGCDPCRYRTKHVNNSITHMTERHEGVVTTFLTFGRCPVRIANLTAFFMDYIIQCLRQMLAQTSSNRSSSSTFQFDTIQPANTADS